MFVKLLVGQHRIKNGKIVEERITFNKSAIMQKNDLMLMTGSIVKVDGGRSVDV